MLTQAWEVESAQNPSLVLMLPPRVSTLKSLSKPMLFESWLVVEI